MTEFIGSPSGRGKEEITTVAPKEKRLVGAGVMALTLALLIPGCGAPAPEVAAKQLAEAQISACSEYQTVRDEAVAAHSAAPHEPVPVLQREEDSVSVAVSRVLREMRMARNSGEGRVSQAEFEASVERRAPAATLPRRVASEEEHALALTCQMLTRRVQEADF